MWFKWKCIWNSLLGNFFFWVFQGWYESVSCIEMRNLPTSHSCNSECLIVATWSDNMFWISALSLNRRQCLFRILREMSYFFYLCGKCCINIYFLLQRKLQTDNYHSQIEHNDYNAGIPSHPTWSLFVKNPIVLFHLLSFPWFWKSQILTNKSLLSTCHLFSICSIRIRLIIQKSPLYIFFILWPY